MKDHRTSNASSYGVAGALMGAVICAGLAATGFYVAFGGGTLQGGIPFLPGAWNDTLGRIVVGLGALVTAAMAGWAIRDLVRLMRK